MDRDRLRRIIAEELARALAGERPATEPGGAGSGGAVGPSSTENLGVVCFTGEQAPGPKLPGLFKAAHREGWNLEGLASFTFRAVVLGHESGSVAGVRVFGEPDDEGALAARLDQARAVIFPDISSNSLNKAALGLADSLPTRAIARSLASTEACLFLETGEPASPVVGLPRLETLRRLERRGAVLAEPENFIEKLRGAASSFLPGPFRSLAGQPVGRSPASRPLVTAEDVAAAAGRGLRRLPFPGHAIVTDRAREEARRRGIELVSDEAAL